jgi:hypothetical protein
VGTVSSVPFALLSNQLPRPSVVDAPDPDSSRQGDRGVEGETPAPAEPANPAPPLPSGSSLLAWAPRGRVAMSLSSWIIDFKDLVRFYASHSRLHVSDMCIIDLNNPVRVHAPIRDYMPFQPAPRVNNVHVVTYWITS